MLRGRGQSKEDSTLAEGALHIDCARARQDKSRGGAAEQSAHILEAARAGAENLIAFLMTGCWPGLDHTSYGFITGDERIAYAWKGGHAACVKEALRAGADAGPFDVDHDICGIRRQQLEAAEREPPRFLQHHRHRIHFQVPTVIPAQ